jgi:glycosyltransferase involved in cell wall biosynthesis
MAWAKTVNHRKLGNAHRDSREWAKAATAYKRHLDANPEDAAIWVQYGHVLKEDGRLHDAEAAYETATVLLPSDPDAWIHLGHLLKRRGKSAAALEALREAAANGAGSDLDATIAELATAVRSEAEPVKSDKAYLFSIQDMFFYLKVHATMSGIQRVQAGLALALMEMDHVDVGFILTDFTGALERGSFWLLRDDDVKTMITYAAGAKVDHLRLKRLLANCEQNAKPILAGEGNTIVLSGAFWGLDNTIDRYLPAKRAGARIVTYIYDIIPISHPQYCEQSLTREFTTGVCELTLICDSILTISDYTRHTLDRFLEGKGGRHIPTATVPLAHSLTGPPSSVQTWPQSMQRLKGREYVTYVSTIEGRKNHAYIVNVWRKLIEQGVKVPDLVFVGRKGWRISGLMDLLEGTRYLDGRVHIVHDLTDAELNAVYENSLFTVFTSFVEGWGLPVGESLMHHIPCVASNTSSIPEVGGDFVDYIDPENLGQGVEVIRKMLTDRAYLAARKHNIVQNFRPRGWPEVAADFVAKMEIQAENPPVEVGLPTLEEGYLFRPADIIDPATSISDYLKNPRRFLIVEDFHGPESFGAWMRGKFGQIRFQTELQDGDEVRAYVQLGMAPWFGDTEIRLFIGNASDIDAYPIRASKLQNRTGVAVDGRIGPLGICTLSIELDGQWEMPDHDSRDFAIGLIAMGYARKSNLEARAEILEAFSFVKASALISQ